MDITVVHTNQSAGPDGPNLQLCWTMSVLRELKLTCWLIVVSIECGLRAWAVHRTNRLNEARALHHSCLGDNSMWRLCGREGTSMFGVNVPRGEAQNERERRMVPWLIPGRRRLAVAEGQLSYNLPSLRAQGPARRHTGGAVPGRPPCRRVCLCNESLQTLSVKSRPWIISSVCVWVFGTHSRPSPSLSRPLCPKITCLEELLATWITECVTLWSSASFFSLLSIGSPYGALCVGLGLHPFLSHTRLHSNSQPQGCQSAVRAPQRIIIE